MPNEIIINSDRITLDGSGFLFKGLDQSFERISIENTSTDSEPITKDEPLAVIKEKIVEEKNEIKPNDNEDVENKYKVILTIVGQKTRSFKRGFYINSKNEISDKRVTSEDIRCVIKTCSSPEFRACFDDGQLYEFCVFLRGDNIYADFDELEIPLRYYDKVKKSLEYVGCEIVEDEESEKIMEEKEIRKISYTYTEKPKKEDIERMISLVDLDTFCDIARNRVLQEGKREEVKNINNDWAKNYLKYWAKAKYRFYKMFGDKLTIETDVQVEKTHQEALNFLYELIAKFPLYSPMLKGISPNALLKNSISTIDKGLIDQDFFDDIKVKEQMKFTSFISLYGNKELDIELSKFYQEKGNAHLTISINPIDYLTVSINRSNWKSCHNFFIGGYRNACVSYMNDETSLVSYRSSGIVEYKKEKNFKWNSKSWRQMIYMSQENSAIVFSRQYPNGGENDDLSKEIRKLLEEKVSEFFGGSHKWKIFKRCDDGNVAVVKGTDSRVYNDVSSGYSHRLIKAKDDIDYDKSATIYIGAAARKFHDNRKVETSDGNIW